MAVGVKGGNGCNGSWGIFPLVQKSWGSWGIWCWFGVWTLLEFGRHALAIRSRHRKSKRSKKKDKRKDKKKGQLLGVRVLSCMQCHNNRDNRGDSFFHWMLLQESWNCRVWWACESILAWTNLFQLGCLPLPGKRRKSKRNESSDACSFWAVARGLAFFPAPPHKLIVVHSYYKGLQPFCSQYQLRWGSGQEACPCSKLGQVQKEPHQSLSQEMAWHGVVQRWVDMVQIKDGIVDADIDMWVFRTYSISKMYSVSLLHGTWYDII